MVSNLSLSACDVRISTVGTGDALVGGFADEGRFPSKRSISAQNSVSASERLPPDVCAAAVFRGIQRANSTFIATLGWLDRRRYRNRLALLVPSTAKRGASISIPNSEKNTE